jgi:HK97 family phage prohead protease
MQPVMETGMPNKSPGERVVKQLAFEIKESDEQRRTVRVVASSGEVDRYGDTIDPNGWMLENFKKNPVILFAHDQHSLPVGKATEVSVAGGNLEIEIEFVPKEVYDFAGTVERMVRLGFLNAVSVGFQPKAYVFNEERGGIDFKEQDLLELSVVPVPALSSALVIGKGMETADVDRLRSWAGQVIKSLDSGDEKAEIPAGEIGDLLSPVIEGVTLGFAAGESETVQLLREIRDSLVGVNQVREAIREQLKEAVLPAIEQIESGEEVPAAAEEKSNDDEILELDEEAPAASDDVVEVDPETVTAALDSAFARLKAEITGRVSVD